MEPQRSDNANREKTRPKKAFPATVDALRQHAGLRDDFVAVNHCPPWSNVVPRVRNGKHTSRTAPTTDCLTGEDLRFDGKQRYVLSEVRHDFRVFLAGQASSISTP
jgi:hypothetical protein